MKYSKKELEKALEDFEKFIKMTKNSPDGTPRRLLIARDLIRIELNSMELFGTIEFDPTYDYKKARNIEDE